ncbi:hypothetical protein E2C01_000591 [Portunus trituberculatus]|uniref:Uncharacterized protein n=1 Tax=Portunus trituberculatus TaxID=210409 RepID=A0A5B7CEI2_PORTR|nr:hypothetical protein [Portunus trituberculatus]
MSPRRVIVCECIVRQAAVGHGVGYEESSTYGLQCIFVHAFVIIPLSCVALRDSTRDYNNKYKTNPLTHSKVNTKNTIPLRLHKLQEKAVDYVRLSKIRLGLAETRSGFLLLLLGFINHSVRLSVMARRLASPALGVCPPECSDGRCLRAAGMTAGNGEEDSQLNPRLAYQSAPK